MMNHNTRHTYRVAGIIQIVFKIGQQPVFANDGIACSQEYQIFDYQYGIAFCNKEKKYSNYNIYIGKVA